MELLLTAAIISYIVYLRYYADFSTKAEKERVQLQAGIDLYNTNQLGAARHYFSQKIEENPAWSIAYLYRARCLRELGDTDAALSDLRTGESYDDTVTDIHVEIGRILYEKREFEAAFAEFDKAVFHSQGQASMPYYWRGLSRQQLGQSTDSQDDLERATTLEQASHATPDGIGTPERTSFFDRRLLTNAAFVLIHSAMLLVAIKLSPVIHWPYLMAAVSAAAIGFAEPRKGWFLAFLQAIAILLGYYLFTQTPTRSGERELEAFCLYGSIGLTFVGSFVGSILKRAMGQ
jgi:tetratricopeptide (TPR) repeat protein